MSKSARQLIEQDNAKVEREAKEQREAALQALQIAQQKAAETPKVITATVVATASKPRKKYDTKVLGAANTLKGIYDTDKTQFEQVLVIIAETNKFTATQVAEIRERLASGEVGAKQSDIREVNKEQIQEIETKAAFAMELWNLARGKSYEERAFLLVNAQDTLDECLLLRPAATEKRQQQRSPGYVLMLTTARCASVSDKDTSSEWDAGTWGILHYGWMVDRDSYMVRPIPVQTRIGAHKVVSSPNAEGQLNSLYGVRKTKKSTKSKSKGKS